MDINNQDDQELLSAYLDGALTAAELAQVESWLASSDAAVSYLDQLRSQRSALKALATAHAPGLKVNFAELVVAQAVSARRSAAAGATDQGRLAPVSAEHAGSSRLWLTVGSFLATAAAIGWLLFIASAEKPAPIQLVDIPKVQPQPESPTDDLPGPAMPEVLAPEALVGSGRQSGDDLHKLNDVMSVGMLFMGDAVMSAKAWDSGRFDELLDKHHIRYGEQCQAKRGLIVDIINNQSLVGAEPEPGATAEAALVYLQGSTFEMNQLMVEMESESTSFTDVRFTISLGGMSLNGKVNFSALISDLRKQSAVSPGQGLARLIVPDDNTKWADLLPIYQVSRRTTPRELTQGAASAISANRALGKVADEMSKC